MDERARTTLVVVHGPPGSGKSTLARQLGPELDLPVFDRDDFKDAMFDALGWSDREWSIRVGVASWELMGLCIERLVRADVSLIADSNFRPDDSFVARMRTLCDETGAASVEVFCNATPAALWDRFDARKRAGGRHPGHIGYENRATFLADLETRPHGPLGLGNHLIELDTTNSTPDAVAIADRIRNLG